MTVEIIVRAEAEADLSAAFQYYEECQSGLGADFILCLDQAISKISRNPDSYPIVYKNIHRILIHRFPFGIYYISETDKIVILAILHARRDPDKWKLRS